MSVLDEIDALYKAGKTEEGFEKMKKAYESEPSDPEYIHRMARHYRDMSSYVGVKDKAMSDKLLLKGFSIIKQGKKTYTDDGNICKWYGCLLDLKSRLEGTDTRIKNSFIVKENLQIAANKLPDDFLANHSMGVWHYEVAAIPYIKRMFAKTIFSDPPTSTYEAALPFLEKAYELSKDKPYPGNLMYLAKCHYYLKNKQESKKFANMVEQLSGDDLDTIEAKNEAKAFR